MKPGTRFALTALLVVAVIAGACTPTGQEVLPRGDGVSLVLLLVVDQARYDYLERFRPLLDGGLAQLLDRGAVFVDAHHNHAVTETAPGHASLSTGLEPAHSGIVANEWYDPLAREFVYSAGLSEQASPVNLQGTALGDWIKAADPRSRVYTASAKDRSAVMLGGQRPDAAYWYDSEEGRWTSSDYYPEAAPEWLNAFHAARPLDRFFGTAWEPMSQEQAWSEFGVWGLDTGVFVRGFPHAIGGLQIEPGPGFYGAIYRTPFVDWYLLELGKALIDNEHLGADGSVDLLGLSFSALDSVGHVYGPDSPEVLDALLRLDDYVADLLAYVDERVGMQHVLVAFSADHGVLPLPEYRAGVGQSGRRLGAEDILCVQRAGTRLRRGLGVDQLFLGGAYLDAAVLESQGLDRADVERRAAAELSTCEAVERVWTAAEMPSEWPVDDPANERFRNNYFPGRSPDVMIQFKPFYLVQQGTGTTHGSVYDYDSHVPLVFMGPGVTPRVIERRVSTVDAAPTLAALIGIEPPADLDGVDRSRLFRAGAR